MSAQVSKFRLESKATNNKSVNGRDRRYPALTPRLLPAPRYLSRSLLFGVTLTHPMKKHADKLIALGTAVLPLS